MPRPNKRTSQGSSGGSSSSKAVRKPAKMQRKKSTTAIPTEKPDPLPSTPQKTAPPKDEFAVSQPTFYTSFNGVVAAQTPSTRMDAAVTLATGLPLSSPPQPTSMIFTGGSHGTAGANGSASTSFDSVTNSCGSVPDSFAGSVNTSFTSSFYEPNLSQQTLPSSNGGSFDLDDQHHHHQHPLPPLGNGEADRTAAQVMWEHFRDELKIESVLCKKLAECLAVREPEQRRKDQVLNIDRRSNVEAVMAHVTGNLPPQPCRNCHKGHGPWTQCVVLGGHLCGSCTNCWYNASGSRCTFHENNHPFTQTVFRAPGPLPAPLAQLPSQGPPSSLVSYQPSSPATVSALAPPVQPNLPYDSWRGHGTASPHEMANRIIDESSQLTKRQRLMVRVKNSARELGMRLAKFEEHTYSAGDRRRRQDRDDDSQYPYDTNRQHSYIAPEASLDGSMSSDALP